MWSPSLLERERSNVDARANAVRLTEAGRAVLAEARPKMAAVDSRLLKLISGGGRRVVFVSLLRDLAQAGAKPAPPKLARPKAKPAKAKAAKPGKAHAPKSRKGKKAKKKAA